MTFFCQGEGRGFESRRPLKPVVRSSDRRSAAVAVSPTGAALPTVPTALPTGPSRSDISRSGTIVRCKGRSVSEVLAPSSCACSSARTLTRAVGSIAPPPFAATAPRPNVSSRPWSSRHVLFGQSESARPSASCSRRGSRSPKLAGRPQRSGRPDRCSTATSIYILDTSPSGRSRRTSSTRPYATLRRGGGVKGQPLSPGTLARVHVVLRSALAQAMRWGWIWDNPAERAHRVVASSAELRPPTPDELTQLLDHVRDREPALHVFLYLAAITGARRAQLLGLRWHNVYFDTCRVSFCAGWVEGPHGPVLTTTKTKRSHVVDLDQGSFAVLADHAESSGTKADGFVFSDDGGTTAWKPNRVTKAFLRHRRAAGLRSFRLHDLRHFMATEMLDAGVPIVVVSRRLDHRRVSTTLDKYAHAVPGGDARASATLHLKLARSGPSESAPSAS